MIKEFPTDLIGFGVYSAIDLCMISDIMDDRGIHYISIEKSKDGVKFSEFKECDDALDNAIDLLKRNGFEVVQKNGQKI